MEKVGRKKQEKFNKDKGKGEDYMSKIEKMLLEEREELRRIVNVVEKRMISVPDGHLRIKGCRGKVEYYIVDDICDADNISKKKGGGRYLRKKDWELAAKIAQRDYDEKTVKKQKEE